MKLDLDATANCFLEESCPVCPSQLDDARGNHQQPTFCGHQRRAKENLKLQASGPVGYLGQGFGRKQKGRLGLRPFLSLSIDMRNVGCDRLSD